MSKLISAALVAAIASVGSAQTARHAAAYVALTTTPAGALPPTVTDVSSSNRWALRYGQYNAAAGSLGAHIAGLTGDFHWGPGDRTEVTLAARTCVGCNTTVMASASFYAEMARGSWSNYRDGGISIGLRPEIGVGRTLDVDATYYSASLGVPISVEIPLGTRAHLQPFVAPGAGYGLSAAFGQREGAARPMLGSGVALVSSGGIGAHLGMQRVFLQGSRTQWGVGLSWSGSR